MSNASAQLSTILAQIPTLERLEAELINALSLLLGMPPNGLRAELQAPRAVPPVPPRVPVGLPSELARRRPDVREAEAKLHAATANIGVATAAFFPSVKLAGSTGLQSLQIGQLFGGNARMFRIGSNDIGADLRGRTIKSSRCISPRRSKRKRFWFISRLCCERCMKSITR